MSDETEEETLVAPPCPACQKDTEPVMSPDGHVLYLCPECDAQTREKMMKEMGQGTHKS